MFFVDYCSLCYKITLKFRQNNCSTRRFAMVTPMEINLAKIFMTNIETKLMNTFKYIYDYQPILFLLFIDDVFLVFGYS